MMLALLWLGVSAVRAAHPEYNFDFFGAIAVTMCTITDVCIWSKLRRGAE